MALNFPDNPTVGYIYGFGSHTWEWDGTAWNTVSNSLTIDDLAGVTLSYPIQANQGLLYDGTKWVNATHTHAIDTLSGTTIVSPVAGQILSYNGTKWVNSAPADTGFNPFLLMGA